MDEQAVKKNIRRIREKLGLSQQAMADSLGVSRTAYRNFENGDTRIFSTYVSRLASLSSMTEEEVVFGGRLDEDGNCEEKLKNVINDYEARLNEKNLLIASKDELIRSQLHTIKLQEQMISMLSRRQGDEA